SKLLTETQGLTWDDEGRQPGEVKSTRYSASTLNMFAISAINAEFRTPNAAVLRGAPRVKAVPNGSSITIWVTAEDPARQLDVPAAAAAALSKMVSSMSQGNPRLDGSCTVTPARPIPPLSVYAADDTL
ncbi:MAG: hypothetical protein KDB18_14285, partial [Salinibacterium sp.]|nr:hypothetical protein [Salinibacterium sp.]